MPYGNMMLVIGEIQVRKFLDRDFKSDEKKCKTKAKTIQQYIEMHAGPEVDLHLRYSLIFVSVFVSFTYGLALPILFPITLFLMIN